MRMHRAKTALFLCIILICSLLVPGYRVKAGDIRVLNLRESSEEDVLLTDEVDLRRDDVESFIVETREIDEDELLEDISDREILSVESVKEEKEGYVSKPASEREILSVNEVDEDIEDIANADDETVSENSVSDNGIISVELPVLPDNGESPFDFIMDPQGLIVATNAIRYDGAAFEEEATLYFKNTEGDYEYSSQSDWLSVKSRSTVSVDVIVEASIEGIDRIKITQDKEFTDSDEPSIYMAVVDGNDNVIPIGEDGKICFYVTLDPISDDVEFSECTFSLVGACNPNGRWMGIKETPNVMLKWHIEEYDPDREIVIDGEKAVDVTDLTGVDVIIGSEEDETNELADELLVDDVLAGEELLYEDIQDELIDTEEDVLVESEEDDEYGSNLIRR